MADLISGMVVDGTERVSELAERLARTFWRGGHCGIAIGNDTGHTMLSPQRYAHSGKIDSFPLMIESGKTGLFSATKAFGSPWGAAGVITYEFETKDVLDLPPHKRFQLMWYVPFYHSVDDCKVNVSVHNMAANEDLWQRMIDNIHGDLIRAQNTVYTYHLERGFEAVVYMGERGPTPLAVTLTRSRNKNVENRQ